MSQKKSIPTRYPRQANPKHENEFFTGAYFMACLLVGLAVGITFGRLVL